LGISGSKWDCARPFLFLFGFLLPFLWWIGSVYPYQEHSDSQHLSEQGIGDEYDHAKKSGYSWAIQWLQKQIVFITEGDMDKHPSMTIAHLHNVRISQETDEKDPPWNHRVISTPPLMSVRPIFHCLHTLARTRGYPQPLICRWPCRFFV